MSTAVSCVALEIADAKAYAHPIQAAKDWLRTHQNDDGLYGDSPSSPANLTATFMSYIALCSDAVNKTVLEKTKHYLLSQFGDFSFQSVKACFLKAYGKDLTFSVPILAMATAAGFFADATSAWRQMPQFPFELALMPERLFHLLNLPVVSYAIPALVCVGIAQNTHAHTGLFKLFRSAIKQRALRVVTRKQPESGGFLEAAPLTAFCALCLCKAGMANHAVTQNALRFLLQTQRPNGAWPIDHDLRQWVTSLSLSVVSESLSDEEKAAYRQRIKQQQTTVIHPYTRSRPGGWGWTTRSGSVPDADDTAAAIIAMHALGETATPCICDGINWLLRLQNRDGGIPTFCRGWSKLPFDQSCPDISAHVFRAFSLYETQLTQSLQKQVRKAKTRIVQYLEKTQATDGSFTPLWFGDQLAADKRAPVYGSAVVLEHLFGGQASNIIERTRQYLINQQHASGGWGSWDNDHDYVIFTARCVRALKPFENTREAVAKGMAFLEPYLVNPELIPDEPIGLYFAHLWYDEKSYTPIFLAGCYGGLSCV
ncbi:MAG: squalene--hopene cyclase [Phycisphaeraceae bacterium]|nr:squalene--hopene cyclase [Phycisphaeraceae bacterium]